MKLYEFSISRSIRAHWMMKEVGADCEIVTVDLQNGEGQSPEFLAINPNGKVPALTDGPNEEFKLWESAAIVTYLGDKYPEKNLVPQAGTYERAHYDQWMCWAQNELDAQLWTMAKHRFIYPEEMRTEAVNEPAKWELEKNLKIFNAHMEGRDYILGDQFTGVDIIMGHTLGWAFSVGVGKDCTNLSNYLTRLKARENYPREMYEKN